VVEEPSKIIPAGNENKNSVKIKADVEFIPVEELEKLT